MSRWSDSEKLYASPWVGPQRHYDILKEATIAFLVVLVLTFVLAITFSSPDMPPVTVQAWAKAQPAGFVDIAISELNRTSNSATYGPPYNNSDNPATDGIQTLGPVSIQKILGVKYSLNTAQDFVLKPLSTLPGDPALSAAIAEFEQAPTSVQDHWASVYQAKLSKEPLSSSNVPAAVPGAGPVPELMTKLLSMAQSGGLDAQLLTSSSFYTTNYTRPLMMIGDSWKAQGTASYWGKIVGSQHLSGGQWGVMNETGSWPGQPWLWLYTMLYQVPPMSVSANGDVEVAAIMAVLSIALLFVPVIPGVRRIPEKLPLHRLIWKRYYRDQEVTESA
ncbi:MAG: hypothetical protein M0Z91_07295 [Actinomycetota bacterium]|nr:hypothetical protein [Actinomycetota bacterium]